MKKNVIDRLVTGFIQYESARTAGLSKLIIADSYLAMDNFFSALLLDAEIPISKNHKQKLELFLGNFTEILDDGIVDSDLIEFHRIWNEARYSSQSSLSPTATLNFLNIARKIFSKTLEFLSVKHNMSLEELENIIFKETIINPIACYFDECRGIHESWQSNLEELGELDYGNRTINKIINPANYSQIGIFSDDLLTKNIISTDVEFGRKIGAFYDSFLELIQYVRHKRYENHSDADEVLNFILTLRLCYYGETIQELEDNYNQNISDIIKTIKEVLGNTKKTE